MTLIHPADLLKTARRHRTAVAAFNIIQLEHAEAVAAGAAAVDRPVILQISENAVRYHGDLQPVGLAVLAIARAAVTPICVHLDHATDETLIDQAIELGFPSVMFDASGLDYQDNLARTVAVAGAAHRAGVWVEAELGEIGGKNGVHAPHIRTDPDQAANFVIATGVDALAVAVGSSHAMTSRVAQLDFQLITALRQAIDIPLVLHGSSGVADLDIVRAIRAGLSKINISTHLNHIMTTAVRNHLNTHPDTVDPRRYLGSGRAAMTAEITRLVTIITGGAHLEDTANAT